MHCCLEPLGYNCIRFTPVQSCPKSIKTKLHKVFSYAMLSGACRATLHRLLTCAMLSQEYQGNIKQDFFLQNVVCSHSDNIAQNFDLCNVIPRVLRQHCTRPFLIQSCLEPFGQHYIGFSPVQCCPKSIEKTFNENFSYAKLSEASRATQHRVFSCTMLSQRY